MTDGYPLHSEGDTKLLQKYQCANESASGTQHTRIGARTQTGHVILTSSLTADESVEFVLFSRLKVTQEKIGFCGDVHRTCLEVELYNLD